MVMCVYPNKVSSLIQSAPQLMGFQMLRSQVVREPVLGFFLPLHFQSLKENPRSSEKRAGGIKNRRRSNDLCHFQKWKAMICLEQSVLSEARRAVRKDTSGAFFVGLLGFGFCKVVLLSPLMYFSQQLSLLSPKNIIKVHRNQNRSGALDRERPKATFRKYF